jgi:hypothetical protein
LDIFATDDEKMRASASITLHALCQDQFESFQAKSSRLATPAGLLNISNYKVLRWQTSAKALYVSKALSGALATLPREV